MNKIEFNLIDEPWIKVRTPSMTVETVSLKEALLRSHCYVDLAGELPTQDAAVLRLLLAVLHTVFSRADADGKEAPIQKPDQALRRWKELWERKQFPEKPVSEYLDRWHERFWLFHPERPFYQVVGIEGTEGKIPKFNGELSQGDTESSKTTKKRLFLSLSGDNLEKMSYADAARWLLYLNGYADVAVAPDKRKNLDVGWMGSLGLVTAVGDNLFETLMLNLVPLKDRRELWGKSKPAWERETVRREDRSLIPIPDNQAELFSLQSRRILLRRNNNSVIGYVLTGGDYFASENAFDEQMTLWTKSKKGDYFPYKPDAGIQIWREFSSLVGTSESSIVPGVVSWFSFVCKKLQVDRQVRFRLSCVYYDKHKSVIEDTVSDGIAFHASLLSDAGEVWRRKVQNEVCRCEKMAEAVGELAGDLEKAAGHVEKDKQKKIVHSKEMKSAEQARELYYHRIDVPFREWLQKLEPAQTDVERDRLCAEWIAAARQLAMDMGGELMRSAGDAALRGRFIEEEKGGRKVKIHYSAPEAFMAFKRNIKKYCEEG